MGGQRHALFLGKSFISHCTGGWVPCPVSAGAGTHVSSNRALIVHIIKMDRVSTRRKKSIIRVGVAVQSGREETPWPLR